MRSTRRASVGLVLPVEADDLEVRHLGQGHQRLVFGAAGAAPGGPDVDQRDLALEVGVADGAVRVVELGQAELGHRLAHQRRGHLARVVAEAPDQQARPAPKMTSGTR
jgi:hypothetical protein